MRFLGFHNYLIIVFWLLLNTSRVMNKFIKGWDHFNLHYILICIASILFHLIHSISCFLKAAIFEFHFNQLYRTNKYGSSELNNSCHLSPKKKQKLVQHHYFARLLI